jgi:hypothetical protein
MRYELVRGRSRADDDMDDEPRPAEASVGNAEDRRWLRIDAEAIYARRRADVRRAAGLPVEEGRT